MQQIELPEGFELVIEPWPYGGPDETDGQIRYFQALCFAKNTKSGNPDSNFYAYPLPIIPVMDFHKNEVIRIDTPATGGQGDGLTDQTHPVKVLDHCTDSEYVPELLPNGTRDDVKPLTVLQPEGPSFTVSDENLVQWQKWSMRVSFNAREGAVLHNIRYDGRDVLYRLSLSEMVCTQNTQKQSHQVKISSTNGLQTVPYADPRPPFHRKQAFDFGDGGLGHCVNNLVLGCDCLGVIKVRSLTAYS